MVGQPGWRRRLRWRKPGRAQPSIARRTPYADNRTTALLGGSVDFLQGLDVWPRCKDKAAELQKMRLVDDTGRLIRAPEVRFSCDEIGLDVFGYNIENRLLVSALEQRAAELSNLTRFDDDAAEVSPEDELVRIRLAHGGSLSAHLAIGADGRQSLCREAAGIAVKRRELDQAALTFDVGHSQAAPEYLDRVSYAARALRIRTAAGRPLERGVGVVAKGSRTADRVERR